MQADVRRKLAMAVRARDFARAHPSPDASFTAVLARLEDRIARADVLALQQRDGQVDQKAAVARRDLLRRTIERQQLRHLVRVAEAAAKSRPDLKGKFPAPSPKAPNKSFIVAARSLLAAALPEKEFFVTLGLGEAFLDSLTASVAEYDAATDGAHAGKRDHVGARADLEIVASQCVEVVNLLDGLIRTAFPDDGELLAAWESARKVVAVHPKADAPDTPVAPVAPAPVGPIDPSRKGGAGGA